MHHLNNVNTYKYKNSGIHKDEPCKQTQRHNWPILAVCPESVNVTLMFIICSQYMKRYKLWFCSTASLGKYNLLDSGLWVCSGCCEQKGEWKDGNGLPLRVCCSTAHS